MIRSRLVGFGAYLPARIVSNAELAARVDALINHQTVAGHRYARTMQATIDTEDFADAFELA